MKREGIIDPRDLVYYKSTTTGRAGVVRRGNTMEVYYVSSKTD